MCQMSRLNSNIFRKYDIRGIVDQDLHYSDAYHIGKAIGTIFLRENITKISIGRDVRLSSDELFENLVKGVNEIGIDVIDIGVIPTPCLYFSVHKFNLEAGIMITGSHNPKDYNGFKIMFKNRSFYGDNVQEIREICENENFTYMQRKSDIEYINIIDDYVEETTKFLFNKGEMNICIDAGNGVTGEIVKIIAKKLNIPEDNLLFCDMDGNFPNHHPDPTVEKNMQDLSRKVIEKSAKFGIGFDGDGDRIGIVDDLGRFIYGDVLMCILSRYLLLEEPNATIISDVKASKVLFDEIKNLGGKPIMWKTGHSFIKDKMKKENAALAGEMSGHVFYKNRYFGFDDGLYAAMRLIEIVEKYDLKLSKIIDELPKTFTTPEIKIEVSDDEKFAIMDKIIRYVKENFENINDIDGVRVDEKDGWWLVRASNTQNCIIMRCEANSADNLQKITHTVNALVEKYL